MNQYKLKIENTQNIFNNNNPVLILNFLYASNCNDVIINNINDMLNVLTSYMSHKKYYLLFFTNFEIPNVHFDIPIFEETYYYKNNVNNNDINTCGSLD